MWERNCACHRFFKVGKWQRYFQVAAGHSREKTETAERTEYAFFRKLETDMIQAERDATEEANHEIKAAIALPPPGEESSLSRIIDTMDAMLREAHSWCFDGPDCMLTWPCRIVLSRFQSPQSESFGKVRPFDPYKEPGTLKTYFGTALRALAYFDRVAATPEYFFSPDTEDSRRPEDSMKPTEEQLEAWREVHMLARSALSHEHKADEERLKNSLLEFWMLLVGHQTESRRYHSPLLSFCAMLSIKPSTQN
ncbi:hypothetical protein B0A55_10993 [Friedmanniomyces simplex]|uniref:Uncharacterized protein n=1 Tax=Friedmanniomyces simplex TaxID=329884 RepID=A0A4U0WHQ7_9PEZI|nr:hypothetical protein B0A55_10993 [Friedmanniomyces simplex]